MFAFNDTELQALIQAWLWPFLRVSGFVLTAPVIGTRAAPRRVRIIFALAVTSVLAPVLGLSGAAPIAPLSATGLAIAAQQLVIGAALGLTLRMVFVVMEFAGQVIAQQMGLGFAAMVDPQSGTQVPVISQFYIILTTLFFFASDAHLALIRLIADSFEVLPIGAGGLAPDGLASVMQWSGTLIGMAVMIMMPIIVALLVVNIAFGVMARAAPQLNIFAVGFPVMILFGVVMMLLMIGALGTAVETTFESGFGAAYGLIGAP